MHQDSQLLMLTFILCPCSMDISHLEKAPRGAHPHHICMELDADAKEAARRGHHQQGAPGTPGLNFSADSQEPP